MPTDDKSDSQFDLKVLRAAVVDKEVGDHIEKVRENPDKVTPDELLTAIRKWFATAEWSDAWCRLVLDWANADHDMVDGEEMPVYDHEGQLYVVGPLNRAWRDMYVRILTTQYQQKADQMDVSSQLGMMGKIPAKFRRGGISLRDFYKQEREQ